MAPEANKESNVEGFVHNKDEEQDITTTIDNSEYPNSIRLTSILIALMFSIFLASLDVTIISTAIPAITKQFHSLEDVGWYGSAMFFPVAATQSMWGKCYKYFPMKIVFLASIAVFEVGSLICALSSSSNVFIAGRVITGVGCAGTFAGCFIVINFCTRPKFRPMATSALSATYALASVIGPIIGGTFTEKLSWRWCFYINLPFGGVAAVVFIWAFKAPKAGAPTAANYREKLLQMDLIGVALVSGTVVCFTLAMRWAGVEKSWRSSEVVGTLTGACLLSIAFAVDQWYQGERALIMASFLRNRTLLIGSLFEFFISGSFYVALFYLPIYFQIVKGVSAMASGIRLLPLVLGLTLTQIILGAIITVTGIFNPFYILGPVITAIGSGLLTMLGRESNAGEWIGFQVIIGIGVGACLTIPLMLAGIVVPPKDVSTATGIIIFSQSIGGALFLAAAQGIFQSELVRLLRQSVPGIDPIMVLTLGTSEDAASLIPVDALQFIIQSFTTALSHTFILAIPTAGIALLVSIFQPWFRYHKPEVANS